MKCKDAVNTWLDQDTIIVGDIVSGVDSEDKKLKLSFVKRFTKVHVDSSENNDSIFFANVLTGKQVYVRESLDWNCVCLFLRLGSPVSMMHFIQEICRCCIMVHGMILGASDALSLTLSLEKCTNLVDRMCLVSNTLEKRF